MRAGVPRCYDHKNTGRIRISFSAGESASFRVADHGPGIPPKKET